MAPPPPAPNPWKNQRIRGTPVAWASKNCHANINKTYNFFAADVYVSIYILISFIHLRMVLFSKHKKIAK